jgi:hypothetical protein
MALLSKRPRRPWPPIRLTEGEEQRRNREKGRELHAATRIFAVLAGGLMAAAIARRVLTGMVSLQATASEAAGAD